MGAGHGADSAGLTAGERVLQGHGQAALALGREENDGIGEGIQTWMAERDGLWVGDEDR